LIVSVRIIALDALDEFGGDRRRQLVEWLEAAAVDVTGPLNADRVDVVLAPGRRPVPGWNCLGISHGPARTTITVEPDCLGRETRPMPDQLRSVMAHELHHCMRARGPGHGTTLGEVLVTEGLAQCYEEEVGCETPNYASAIRGPVLDKLKERAIAEVHSSGYDHAKWFFGSRTDPSYPWAGGYSLGYLLVKSWIEVTGTSTSRAVRTPAGQILRESPFAAPHSSTVPRVLS
jgi:hypothetical protein